MDSSKYVNTYLDFAVGMLHEATNEKLQLRTQLKLANDLVAERDQVISALNRQIEEAKNKSDDEIKLNDDLDSERKKSKQWEDSYHALNNKLSHFDNLTNQFNDIKSQLQIKNQDVQRLTLELSKVNEDKSSFEKNKNEEINALKVVIQQNEVELNKHKLEIEELVKKIAVLEATKKQINTTTSRKKLSTTILPLQDYVEPKKLEKTENNDF